MQSEELMELAARIKKDRCETRTIEVKAAAEGCPKKLYGTMSAFSNQDGGGIIIFGIDEKRRFEAVGFYDPQDLIHKVAEQCKEMEPVLRPLFTTCDVNGKVLVSAEFPGIELTQRPVYYKGAGRVRGSYIRVGEADEPMTDYEIYSYEAYRKRIHDDIRTVEDTNVSQLDPVLIDKFLALSKAEKHNLSKLSDGEISGLMGVTAKDKLTLSGVLCFHKYPQSIFPQLCITAIVVPGNSVGDIGASGERFTDNKRIEGTIPQMLEEAILFVGRNMKKMTIIDRDGRRSDREEYPIIAVREAVLNALMHRDYSIHTEGAPIRLILYGDRLEIINEGGLYGRLTLKTLGTGSVDTRNQKLANILEIMKTAENRYSGIPTIKSEMKKHGLPEPIFEDSRGRFCVTLKNSAANFATDGLSGLLAFCSVPRNRDEIYAFIGKSPYYVMKKYVTPLLSSGKLRMTLPDKPKSKNQRYYSAV